jgi:hypothetical protein
VLVQGRGIRHLFERVGMMLIGTVIDDSTSMKFGRWSRSDDDQTYPDRAYRRGSRVMK